MKILVTFLLLVALTKNALAYVDSSNQYYVSNNNPALYVQHFINDKGDIYKGVFDANTQKWLHWSLVQTNNNPRPVIDNNYQLVQKPVKTAKVEESYYHPDFGDFTRY